MLLNLMLLSLIPAHRNAWTHRGPSQRLTRYWTRDARERLSAFRFAWFARLSKVGQWMRRVSQKKHLGPQKDFEITSEGNLAPDPALIFSIFQNRSSTRPQNKEADRKPYSYRLSAKFVNRKYQIHVFFLYHLLPPDLFGPSHFQIVWLITARPNRVHFQIIE